MVERRVAAAGDQIDVAFTDVDEQPRIAPSLLVDLQLGHAVCAVDHVDRTPRHPAEHGRLLEPDDYRLKRNVAVLADGVWKRWFGGNPAIVGQSVRLDDATFEIVGVLPAGYEPKILGGRGPLDVWTPKTVLEDHERQSRTGGYWNVVARVKPGGRSADRGRPTRAGRRGRPTRAGRRGRLP